MTEPHREPLDPDAEDGQNRVAPWTTCQGMADIPEPIEEDD